MALAVNHTEENELNWADLIDGLRYGAPQKVPSKRAAQPDSPTVALAEGAAQEGRASRDRPEPLPH